MDHPTVHVVQADIVHAKLVTLVKLAVAVNQAITNLDLIAFVSLFVS